MKRFLPLLGKELGALFGSPIAWILIGVFLGLMGYSFTVTLFNNKYATLIHIFFQAAGLMLLVVPVITMRSFAEERKQGTLELLWTWPVRDVEVLTGKFLAALVVYLAMLATTVIGPAVLYALHPFAIAPVVAGYTGMALLGVAFISCGLAASTVTENQVVAAMLTYGVLVFSWFATWNEAAIGERIAPILLQLSLFDHFYGFAQGVIDSADVVYLLAFAALFLFLALRSLGTRAWRGIP